MSEMTDPYPPRSPAVCVSPVRVVRSTVMMIVPRPDPGMVVAEVGSKRSRMVSARSWSMVRDSPLSRSVRAAASMLARMRVARSGGRSIRYRLAVPSTPGCNDHPPPLDRVLISLGGVGGVDLYPQPSKQGSQLPRRQLRGLLQRPVCYLPGLGNRQVAGVVDDQVGSTAIATRCQRLPHHSEAFSQFSSRQPTLSRRPGGSTATPP